MGQWTPFGPGTVIIGGTGTELDFTCEVLGGSVAHEYEDVGSDRRNLCGDERRAARRRRDRVRFKVENDLTAAGLYAYLYGKGEDPAAEPISYTPNTAGGAGWAGSIIPLLPAEIGAGEYAEPIASEVDWPADGLLTFTPATAAP